MLPGRKNKEYLQRHIINIYSQYKKSFSSVSPVSYLILYKIGYYFIQIG